MMPNQPDSNKVLVGVRTPRELVAVLSREADELGLKLPRLIVRILQQYVGDPAKQLSRFELEDLEEEKRAARESRGSRRSARNVGRKEGFYYEPELVTGGMQSPVSESVWRATMESLAPGWHVQEEEDGFYLGCERVPGCVGVCCREMSYVVYASYLGGGAAAEFAKPLKWRYGGRRSGGSWHVPLAELGLGLRPIVAGELMSYLRSGKDDALRKVADVLRELITCLRAYHRRAEWSSAVLEPAQKAGWSAYVENWRFLRCCREQQDNQVGQVQLLAYEPIEGETMRLEMQLATRSSGHLRTLLRAMGRRDLQSRVRNGSMVLEEIEMSLSRDSAADAAHNTERLVQRLLKWMQRVNAALAEGLPLDTFAALAAETANYDFASICDLGVVIVRRGKISKKISLPVQPEGNAYEEKFTEWHGISAADTAEAPSFAAVWAHLEPLLKGLPLVVHSSGVASRLLAAFDRAALPRPEFSLLQNLPLARSRFPELPSHNLHALAAHMNYPITTLGALPKALATARIALEFFSSAT